MENLFSLWKVREIADKVTNVVMNYTEIEAKVREATNDEAWGPTGALMQELAHATFTYEHFPEVMSMLWKRMLQDSKQHWRRTYKGLLVLNYLVRNGSERVVTSSREHIYDLRSLENYTFIDENGKDQGVNIRHKVKELIDFIQDDDRLREERKKAKKNKDKYIGMSSDMVGMRFGGSERWDEKPYTRSEFVDQEWDDSSTNRYRDKSYEEDEDRDNVDSDGEGSPRNGKSNNNTIKFKDEGRAGSPTSASQYTEKRVNLNLSSNITASPKRVQKPLKKVDLGAAANFGRDLTQSPLPRPPSGGGNADLFDDFDPRAGEKAEPIVTNDFGDFEAVFSGTAKTVAPSTKTEDDFADFSSAFSTSSSTTPSSLLTSPTTPTVLPNVIPPTMGVPNQNLLMSANNVAQTQPANLLGGPPVQNNALMGGNLLGLGLETATAQNPIQIASKNNEDLLGDLKDFGGLSIQPKPAVGNGNNNNINFGLTGGQGLLDNFDDETKSNTNSYRSGSRKKTTVQAQLEDTTVKTVERLRRISKISSQADIDNILDILDDVVTQFPVNNAQKLMLVDEIEYRDYAENHFKILLIELINLFDHSFPFQQGRMYDGVVKVFTVEDPDFFEITLLTLRDKINAGANVSCIVGCLETVLLGDGLFVDMVMNSYKDADESSWQIIVRLLISLPNRISNVLERDTPDLFVNKNYSNLLMYNFLKAVEFIVLVVFKEPKFLSNFNFGNLAYVLSKISIHFNDRNNCEALNHFVDIVAQLTNKQSDKCPVYRRIFNKIFELLDKAGTEILAKLFLTRVDPRKYFIKNILDKDLINTDNWRYCLCTKIPLLTYPETNHEYLVPNLVVYLDSGTHKYLEALLLNLLRIWADKPAIKRTSVEHHLLISKYIVALVNCGCHFGFTETERKQIRDSFRKGISVHLECTVPVLRYSGMKTGEYIARCLSKEDDEKNDENELKFEYDNLKPDCLKAVNDLQYFIDLDFPSLYMKSSDIPDNVQDILTLLSNKADAEQQYDPPQRKLRIKRAPVRENELVILDPVKVKDYGITIIDNDFQIDSDDDLEPYDLSNDVPVPGKEPPAYLRDLRDNLVETEDPDVFALTLQHAESLVSEQLPNDDAKIGLEILEILINLDCKYYVDNFEELVFRGCVAITCVYPSIYAEYLCKEVHADVGKYSLVHRLMMLDILRQSAKCLSEIKPVNKTKEPEQKSTLRTNAKEASEVIRKRLESKTRYFHTHKAVKLEQKNRFADVAGYFFFPLLYGYNQNKLLSQQLVKDSDDFMLLIHFIDTLAIIMFCSENCNVVHRMAKESLHFSWFMRYHKDPKVKASVLHLIGSVVTVVPDFMLIDNFMNELFEIRLWLTELLNPNAHRGDPNLEVRHLAACTIAAIEHVLKNDVDE
ncbi:clathrin interactor lqfR [Rhynchophorus ferrugineus]|uniref:clathrin interactor lqfR n=1 Tax=Rhynchophorus ferrugineus TaxID=354439 RepID=UPI003FCDB786